MNLETVLLIAVGFLAGLILAGFLRLPTRQQQGGDSLETAFQQALQQLRLELLELSHREREQDMGSLQQVVRPLESSLSRFEEQIQQLEQSRQRGFGSLRQYLDEAIRGQAELRYQTHRLVSSLRSSNTRGRWGEISLKRAVELAGMVEHCDFEQQPRLPDSRLRPDLIVRLPNQRCIVVDAKVPMKAYLSALECEDELESERLLDKHARQILNHAEALASRRYWSHLESSPEFVVLFLPLESLLSQAMRARPELLDETASRGVIPATPATLIALLKAVEYGWKQESLNRNATLISELAGELHSQVGLLARHLTEVGRHLDQAAGAYNRSLVSLETELFEPVRKLAEMGISTSSSIVEPKPVRRNGKNGEW